LQVSQLDTQLDICKGRFPLTPLTYTTKKAFWDFSRSAGYTVAQCTTETVALQLIDKYTHQKK